MEKKVNPYRPVGLHDRDSEETAENVANATQMPAIPRKSMSCRPGEGKVCDRAEVMRLPSLVLR